MENDVSLGGLQSSIDLSRQTAESWSTLWETTIDPANGLWQGLVALGLLLATFSILYLALTTGKDIIEKQSWGELASLFAWPIIIVIFLGQNGYLLANATLLVRHIGHTQVVEVLERQVDVGAGNVSFEDAITDIGVTLGAREAIARLYRECQQYSGDQLQACWENAMTQTQAIINAAEQRAGGTLQELRDYGAALARATSAEITEAELAEARASENMFMDIFRSFLISFVQIVLLGLQWAFVNMLEAALLLTALFAPIAMGLSLLPLQGRPIVAWLVGFISLFGVQLGYNIIVGLVASVVTQAGAITASDVAFMLFLSIFAPALALMVAGGGGIALYSGVQAGVKTSIQVFSDAIGYGTRQFARRWD